MSRWTRYRQLKQRKRNAFVLLTMSGAIRSADVEVPFLRETRCSGPRRGLSSTADGIPQAEHPSIWSMDLRQLFSRNAGRPIPMPSTERCETVYSKQRFRLATTWGRWLTASAKP